VKFLLSLIAAASLQTAHSLCHRYYPDGYKGSFTKVSGYRQKVQWRPELSSWGGSRTHPKGLARLPNISPQNGTRYL